VTVSRHPAGARPSTSAAGRVTRHSLSFGPYYDPDNVVFGGLMAHNDDLLEPGAGYPDHPHADVEIVTWVLAGVLAHRDSGGGAADLTPGTVQVQSAGAGIRHSEVADRSAGPTRFVQAWVRPDEPGGQPRRGVAPVDPAPGSGWVPLASGARPAALGLGAAGATLWAARLAAGEEAALPVEARQHVFVASGGLILPAASMSAGPGDAVRLTDEPGHLVVATSATELLVWGFAR